MTEAALHETLGSYVPRFIQQHLLSDPVPLRQSRAEQHSAALLFIDITGFTELAERMAARGASGVEELSYLLNVYIEEAVDLIILHGGDIIKFAGDALIALWSTTTTDEDLPTVTYRAAQCGLLVQAMLHDQQPLEGVRLSLRVGVGVGNTEIAHVGGERDRWEFLVAGEPLSQASTAQNLAEPGQVILSPEAWALVAERCEGELLPSGVARIDDVLAPLPFHISDPIDLDAQAEPALQNYIPGAILARLTAKQSDWLAEVRRVTVLFVNLPEIGHGMALEQMQMLMRRLQIVLYRYEGSINKLSADDKGTSLLAALGLPPLAHPDDALRGIETALEMRAVLRELGVQGAIGVTTGPAFCGVLGSQRRREYTLLGDTVNLAARLMQVAPDQIESAAPILCDEETYQATKDYLHFNKLPAISLKGKADLVPIYTPVAPKQSRLTEIVPIHSGDELIGRLKEHAFLSKEIDDLVQGGTGKVILLDGEAGIGKSRLVVECLRQADEIGLTTLIGSGNTIEKLTPYHAWRGVFNRLFDIEGVTDQAERNERVLDYLDSHFGLEAVGLAPLLNDILQLNVAETDQTSQLLGQTRADYTRDLLVRLLADLTVDWAPVFNQNTAPNGLMLVLEDAHWLDSASWALALAVSQRVQPLLLIIAKRPRVYIVSNDYEDLLASAQVAHLRLDVLSPKDARQLVCQALQVSSLGESLGDFIFEKAEGHPFFTKELVHNLHEAQLLRFDQNRCHLVAGVNSLNALEFSPTIQGVITSRIDRLAAEEQLILKVASVIGRSFSDQTLQDIYPLTTDQHALHHYLKRLVKLDILLVETPEPKLSYRFKHIITQEVAYELMPMSQRRQLHRAAAEWYEKTYVQDLTPFYSVLAYHWSKAVPNFRIETAAHAMEPALVYKTVNYLVQASEQVLRSYANQEAIDFFNRALSLVRTLPKSAARDQQELNLLIALGNPLIAAKGFAAPEVQETYTQARKLCQEMGGTSEIFYVLQGLLGLYYTRADLRSAYDVAKQLLELAHQLEDPFLVLKGEYGLGHTLTASGNFLRAIDCLKRAVSLYDPVKYREKSSEYQYQGVDPGVGAQSYAALCLWMLGYPDRAARKSQSAMRLAHELGHPTTLALALGVASLLCLFRQDIAGTARWSDELAFLSERQGFPFWLAWGKIMQAWSIGKQGDADAGISQLREGLAALHATGATLFRPYYQTLLAELAGQAGQVTLGLRLIDEAFRRMSRNGERFCQAEIYRVKGELLLQQTGTPKQEQTWRTQAETAFIESIRIARKQSARSLELRTIISLSQLWYTSQSSLKHDAAKTQLQQIYNWFSEGFDSPDMGQAQALLDALNRVGSVV